MKNSTFTFDGQDGKKIFTYKWESDDKPRACLLIAHGTAEHAARYENLAAHFATSGFTSYACDLRGHGKTADGKLGVVGPDGWVANASLDHVVQVAGCGIPKSFPKTVGHLITQLAQNAGRWNVTGQLLFQLGQHPQHV